MSVKGMELRDDGEVAASSPGLNSARATAACRSVRDASLQASPRLQGCQSLVAGNGQEKAQAFGLCSWAVGRLLASAGRLRSKWRSPPGSAAGAASGALRLLVFSRAPQPPSF
jgi:hypothetical protein